MVFKYYLNAYHVYVKQPIEIITKSFLKFLTFNSAHNAEALWNADKFPWPTAEIWINISLWALKWGFYV